MSQADEQDGSTGDGAGAGDPSGRKSAEQNAADTIGKDDPHKVEKLSRLGHAGDEAAEGTE